MRALPTLVVLLLIAMTMPGAQAISAVLPEEVCMQTVPTHFTQYHCAGLDEAQEQTARVIRVQDSYTMQAVQCVGIEGGSTVTVTVYVETCAAWLTGFQPVAVATGTVTLRPIHVEANIGSIPAACDVLGDLCPVISTPAVCPAWGCGPIVTPCPLSFVDACVTSDFAHARIDAMALADIDQDGVYDGVGLHVGRAWIVVEAVECHPPSISTQQTLTSCDW